MEVRFIERKSDEFYNGPDVKKSILIKDIDCNCPYCNNQNGLGILGQNILGEELVLALICNNSKCREVIIFRAVPKKKEDYTQKEKDFCLKKPYDFRIDLENGDQYEYENYVYEVAGFSPSNVMSLPIEYKSDFFSRISPDFIKIYNQSEIALSYKLNEVAGPGYRKALEYLVKDYAVNHNPEEISKIEKSNLGKCILEYLTLPEKGKELLRRASWLGNDEVHYKRKWVEKDIEDLRKVIQLVLTFIKTDHETQELIESMPDDK